MAYKTIRTALNRIRNKDLEAARRLRIEYDLALAREDYDTALQMVNGIDQIFYERGLDYIELSEDLEIRGFWRK